MNPLDLILSKLDGVKRRGDHYECKCPGPTHQNGDRHPSLSITENAEQAVLVKCHAGCETSDIMAAVGLEMKDLFPKENSRLRMDPEYYDYTDADGTLLYQVIRKPGKKFFQRRPNGSGGWINSMKGIERVPYRLPEVVEAILRGETVYIVEGEKDADRLVALGLTATCNSGGAGKWSNGLSRYFQGGDTIILSDNDDTGRAHARDVADSLEGIAAFKMFMLPGLPPKGDVSDWLADGHSKEELLEIVGADEPAGQAPDALELIEDVMRFIKRFVSFSSGHQLVAIALWIFHTYVIEAAETTPYLQVHSPEKRSGKTRLLETIELLVFRPWRVASPTEAVLFRKIAEGDITLLFDEYDAMFSDKNAAYEGIRAVLNSGYRRGLPVPRCVGEGKNTSVKDFHVFCPKTLSGIGKLPETVSDRSIPIALKRRKDEQPVERFIRRRVEPDAKPIRERLQAWASKNLDALIDASPDLPDELNDRAADGWEPLFAIANLLGGEWSQTARDAALNLHGAHEDESSGVLLLAHIKAALKGHDKLSTVDILKVLVAEEEGPWGEWWGAPVEKNETRGPASRLAKMLKPYGIKPKTVRVGTHTVKGYEREQFSDTWKRYLDPPLPQNTGERRNNETQQVDTPISPKQLKTGISQNRGSKQGCYDVTSLDAKQTEQSEEADSFEVDGKAYTITEDSPETRSLVEAEKATAQK